VIPRRYTKACIRLGKGAGRAMTPVPFSPPEMYQFSIIETAPVGTAIGRVKAEDSDVGENTDMTYQMREINFATLEDMQQGALSVEVNLMEKRARMKTEKRVSFREESTPSTSSSKMEKMMEEMMK